ncbi:MAG: ATP synthase F1 subunit epsilon [Thermoleophilaceae bacterium]
MARSTFPVEVLTPEGRAWEGEVEMISTRTAVGSIGVLANHAPLMAMLEPSELRLYTSRSETPERAETVRFAQGEGYLQVVDNSALLIVEDAIAPDALDRPALEARLGEARDGLDRAEPGTEEHARLQREIKRAETFLAVEA